MNSMWGRGIRKFLLDGWFPVFGGDATMHDHEKSMSTANMLSRRATLRLLGLGAGVTLLAACAPAAATPTPVPTQTVAPTPQITFRVDESSDVASLNPLLFNATPTRRRAVLMFSGLYQYDAKRNLVPDLAESLPQMPDPQTYSIKLRPDLRFHSGKQVTSDDVRFTYETLLKPEYAAIWRTAVASVLDSVTAPDSTTVVFRLKRPFGPFLAKLALIPIVNSDQSKDELALKPDGTGPFKFVAYQKGSSLELARHDAYHLSELKPKLGSLTINVVPENATRYANLANGITHLAPEPGFSDLDLLRGRGVAINSVPAPASTYGYVNFKRADGPMTDKSLRRALAFALDRSAIVSNIWAGQGLPGQVFIRPELWVYDPKFKPFSDKPDLDKARAELSKSTRAGDRIVITTANDDALSGTAVLMQAAARAAGLNVDIAQVDRAAFAAELTKDGWDVILTDSYTGSNSGFEADAVNSLLVTNASANFGKYSNPEMDKEVEQAVFAASREAALPHFNRIMEIDAEEIPILTVAYHNYIEALSPKVKNYQTSGLASYDLRTAELG
jgi:peptide/nickel transport system substrate-binding protein